MGVPLKRPEDPLDPLADLDRAQQREIEVSLERRRYGKEVTVLTGFAPDQELAAVARHLKRRLATGGSAKGLTVELQGDQVARLGPALEELGLHVKET